MKQWHSNLIGIGILLTQATLAHAHGMPIHVEVADNKLIVSQGVPDSLGFASMMYVEADDDGDPFAELDVPPFGRQILWQVPGFDIFGMNDASNLSLEVLRPSVLGSSPPQGRTLWYWNDQTQLVEPAPAAWNLHLLARDHRALTISPADLIAPPPLLLSDPMTGQQGFHNHGLLLYGLDDSVAPPSGAYAFFARVTSTFYAPSDPFLVVLNESVDYAQMLTAAGAINVAAVQPEPTPGDYDGNGRVELNDYQFWRARFGNLVEPFASPDGGGNGLVDAADYIVWRDHISSGVAAVATAIGPSVPEPNGHLLALLGLLIIAPRRFRHVICAIVYEFLVRPPPLHPSTPGSLCP